MEFPNIPEEGKLRVLVVFIYVTIFFAIALFFIGLQGSCLNQGISTWSCVWKFKWIYLILWLGAGISFSLFMPLIFQIIKQYRIKDEYAGSMKTNITLQNYKLLDEMDYYKDKNELREVLRKYLMGTKIKKKKKWYLFWKN
jgi:hypothetical protein